MSLGNPDRPVGALAVPTPSGVELRPLGRDDLADAAAMARERRGLPPAADLEGSQPAAEALLSDPDAAPYLAIADGAVVGLIDVRFRRRLNHATFEGWIGEWFVREAHRGRGIGRALLAAAVAEWRLRGGHQVEVEVPADATAAMALLEAGGFANQGKVFVMAPVAPRSLPPGEGVEIRPIADEDTDFDATTRLLAELGRPAPDPDRLPALRRTYAGHVGRAETGSMLALLDGAPVGFVSLEFRTALGDAAPHAWIPDLLVTESARGRRIGAALLDAAFAESVRRGASEVALESGHQRLVAHRLYATAGMADVGSFFTLRR